MRLSWVLPAFAVSLVGACSTFGSDDDDPSPVADGGAADAADAAQSLPDGAPPPLPDASPDGDAGTPCRPPLARLGASTTVPVGSAAVAALPDGDLVVAGQEACGGGTFGVYRVTVGKATTRAACLGEPAEFVVGIAADATGVVVLTGIRARASRDEDLPPQARLDRARVACQHHDARQNHVPHGRCPGERTRSLRNVRRHGQRASTRSDARTMPFAGQEVAALVPHGPRLLAVVTPSNTTGATEVWLRRWNAAPNGTLIDDPNFGPQGRVSVPVAAASSSYMLYASTSIASRDGVTSLGIPVSGSATAYRSLVPAVEPSCREGGNRLTLPDPERHISRVQARVLVEGGRYMLEDLGGNPTLINDRPVGRGARVLLTDGDRVCVGQYEMRVDQRPAQAASQGARQVGSDPLGLFGGASSGGLDPFGAPPRSPSLATPAEDPFGVFFNAAAAPPDPPVHRRPPAGPFCPGAAPGGAAPHQGNHGQFNIVWANRDRGWLNSLLLNRQPLLSEQAQQEAAQVFITAFLEASLRDEAGYRALFANPTTGNDWLPDTIIVTQYESAGFVAVDSNRTNSAPTRLDNPDGTAWTAGMATWATKPLLLRDGTTKQQNSALYLAWDAGSEPVIGMELGNAAAIPVDSALTFALTTALDNATPISITIELESVDGQITRLPLSQFGPVYPPLPAQLVKAGWLAPLPGYKITLETPFERVLQTYTLPLLAFQQANPAFDPGAIQVIRFFFAGTEAGAVYLDQVVFVQE